MPDRFILSIKLGNDAMQTPDDVANVLETTAAKIRSRMQHSHTSNPETGEMGAFVCDANGNVVGSWEFTASDPLLDI